MTCDSWQTGDSVHVGNIEKVPGFPCLGQVTAYRGMGLRSPGFSCSFRASRWGWELTEAPGTAEVGAQGMGRGAGLPEEEAREDVSRAEPRMTMVRTTHLPHARQREDLGLHRVHASKWERLEASRATRSPPKASARKGICPGHRAQQEPHPAWHPMPSRRSGT